MQVKNMKNVLLVVAMTALLAACDKEDNKDNDVPVYGSWTAEGTSFTATNVYRSEVNRTLTATDIHGNSVNVTFLALPTTSDVYSIVQSADSSWEMAISITLAGGARSYFTRGDDNVDGTVTITQPDKIAVYFPSVKVVRQGGGDSLQISGTIIEH